MSFKQPSLCPLYAWSKMEINPTHWTFNVHYMALTQSTTRLFCNKSVGFISGIFAINHRKVKL